MAGPGGRHTRVSSAQDKVATVMHEFKRGRLHSGSKQGPVVRNKAQAIAIAISESKRRKRQKAGA